VKLKGSLKNGFVHLNPPNLSSALASGAGIKSLEFLLGFIFIEPREPDSVKYSVKSSSREANDLMHPLS